MHLFLGKKELINRSNFCQKPKKYILEEFLDFFSKMRIFLKNSAASAFDPYDPQTSWKISEKLFTDLATYWPTDRGSFIGHFPPKGRENGQYFFKKNIMVWTSCMSWKQFSLKRQFQKSIYILWRLKFSRGENFTVDLKHEILRILRGFNFLVLSKTFFSWVFIFAVQSMFFCRLTFYS